MPGQAAEVCQRCLAQANPYSGSIVDTAVPVALLVALPAAAAALLAVGLAHALFQRARRSRQAATRVLRGASRHVVLGHEVRVVNDDRPFALSFPARHGGVVISAAALASLDHDELAAVFAHERAHLRQRHHLTTGIVAVIARRLGWIPFSDGRGDRLYRGTGGGERRIAPAVRPVCAQRLHLRLPDVRWSVAWEGGEEARRATEELNPPTERGVRRWVQHLLG